MKEHDLTSYSESIRSRTRTRYFKGLIPRFYSHLRNAYIVWLARARGATVGSRVTMPYGLAKKANANLTVGCNTSIQTERIDLRCKVDIGNFVIIGSDVEILTMSHDVDSPLFGPKNYGLAIEDYCWIATRAFILPSCRNIGRGAVCAAGSVVVGNVAAMSIVAGNPAKFLRARADVHGALCVESLLGNDYVAYVRAYRG